MRAIDFGAHHLMHACNWFWFVCTIEFGPGACVQLFFVSARAQLVLVCVCNLFCAWYDACVNLPLVVVSACNFFCFDRCVCAIGFVSVRASI